MRSGVRDIDVALNTARPKNTRTSNDDAQGDGKKTRPNRAKKNADVVEWARNYLACVIFICVGASNVDTWAKRQRLAPLKNIDTSVDPIAYILFG